MTEFCHFVLCFSYVMKYSLGKLLVFRINSKFETQ